MTTHSGSHQTFNSQIRLINLILMGVTRNPISESLTLLRTIKSSQWMYGQMQLLHAQKALLQKTKNFTS